MEFDLSTAQEVVEEAPPQHNPGLQEITDYGQGVGKELKIALGHITTLNPDAQADIVRNTIPEAKVIKDAKGYYVVDINGEQGFINRPGLSPNDFTTFLGNALQYVPAASIASFAKSVLGRMTAAAPAMYATNQAQQAGARELGSEQPNSQAESITAAAFGTAGEAVAPVLGAIAAPAIQRGKQFLNQINPPRQAPFDASRNVINGNVDQEFGIPYTQGQATQNTRQLQREENFRKGGLGPRAHGTMQTFDDAQARAINDSTAVVQGKIAQPQRPPIGSENEGAAVVQQGIQGQSQAAKQVIGDAYDEVSDAALTPSGFDGLWKRMRAITRNIEFDKTLPKTKEVLEEITSVQKAMRVFGPNLKPVHIQKLEQMRRRLNKKINSAQKNDPSDHRQVIQLKQQFDEYLDEAVDNALFLGDETALASLKKARGLRADYARKFQQSGKYDEAGKVVQRLVEDTNLTPEQVVNYLFGRAELGGKGASVHIVRRLKEVFGDGSQEFDALRQMAIMRVIHGPRQGRKVSGRLMKQRLDEAVSGRGESLMKELFTGPERAMLGRYVSAVTRAQPELFNPSGTADAVSRIAQDAAKMFGMAADAKTFFLFSALGKTKPWLAGRAARKATQPQSQRPPAIVAPSASAASAEPALERLQR